MARLSRRLDRCVGRRDAGRLLRRAPRQDRHRRAVRRPRDGAVRRHQLGGGDRRARRAVAGWSWEYGLVEFFRGPVAKATNNTDLSWLAAFVVSGGLYYVLRPI